MIVDCIYIIGQTGVLPRTTISGGHDRMICDECAMCFTSRKHK